MSRFRKKKGEFSSSLEEMVGDNPSSSYEALQLYKSKINRFRVAGQYDQALSLTCQAAKLQLKYKYENSGNELGGIFVDILTESKFGLKPEYRNLINEIADAFDNVSGLGLQFLKDCISLSKELGPRVFGDELLHRRLAMKLWNVEPETGNEEDTEFGNYRHIAVLHFALGEAPGPLWMQIVEDPTMDPSVATWTGETKREQIVLLGVLYFLSLENLRDANDLMRSFRRYRQEKGIEKESRTYEFMDRLLLTSLRDARQLFQQLMKAYEPQLKFHPIVLQLLNGPIAKKIFGIQAPPNVMSMIANLFG